jgi:UDP-N-acetylglucosamine 4-epimerase
MYDTKYHNINLKDYNFLITGGAGFIGSNIVEYLIKYGAKKVRVLDDLSNGSIKNVSQFMNLPNFEFIKGDIRNLETCIIALDNINFVSHQAALGSIPRSINDPINTNNVNVDGFLNMLDASKNSRTLINFVYAASSSTYGDSITIPKIEDQIGKPLNPYALTKAINEMYADIYNRVYNFNSIGLRYFNVFGPKQNSNNPYAAVIPIFCDKILNNQNIVINGDGLTSRDFTFIENVVQANIKALFLNHHNNKLIGHRIYNVACGNQYTLLELVSFLEQISNKKLNLEFNKSRIGDIKNSLASIEKIKLELGYNPIFEFKDGLYLTYNWYLNNKFIENE